MVRLVALVIEVHTVQTQLWDGGNPGSRDMMSDASVPLPTSKSLGERRRERVEGA